MNFVQTIEVNLGLGQQDEIDRLEHCVRRRLNGRVREFRVLARADGLILQGNASTYHAKQLAQHAIMSATQLPILSNDIEVCDLMPSL